MAKKKEQDPGGDKSQYLGNHSYTTEAGHKVEFDNTPGDRRIHIYHASGTFIEIKDDGARIAKNQGETQEWFNKGKVEKISGGDFNITVDGNAIMHVTGNLKHEVKGNYEIVTHGEFRVKSSGKHIIESGGDQRIQVNGKTSHRTSGDREEITGGKKIDTINKDLDQTVGGDNTQTVSGDNATLTGKMHQIVAVGQIGLGAGGILGLTSAEQVQMSGQTGTFITDAYCIQCTSTGALPVFIWSKGYKAGVFSSTTDIILGAGGKVLSKTDGGTQLDTAGLIAPVGKTLPS